MSRKYRGVEILDLIPCLNGGCRYAAKVGEYTLLAHTLPSIKQQIGRALNGFNPADCVFCREACVDKPLLGRPQFWYCSAFQKDMNCEDIGDHFNCEFFQTRD